MYIQKVIIENIRSISHFEMDFPNPAGWHVLIGDNGTGKTTILKAIASASILEDTRIFNDNEHFVQETDTKLYPNPVDNSWIKSNEQKGKIYLKLGGHNLEIMLDEKIVAPPETRIGGFSIGKKIEIFTVGYGSLRITHENNFMEDIKPKKYPQILAHETLLRDKTTLMGAELWLKDLQYAVLENGSEQKLAKKLLTLIINLINTTHLLSNNLTIEKIGRAGISFRNIEGTLLNLRQLSDGFRSILNITIDLIYRMVGFYGEDKVIQAFDNPQKICNLSGIVFIDEIDAHLHPTWQTRIGQWFTQYFPNIQFIVTTHSPLICRACEKGSIWRLAAPDSEIPSGEIVGVERERLIFGNILDAYGTEAFGQSPVRSEKSNEMLQKLGELNMRAAFGKITAEEEIERQTLQQIFQTDVAIS